MASGDNNNLNKEESDDEDCFTPEPESDQSIFARQFLNVVAERDVVKGRNEQAAKSIINKNEKTGITEHLNNELLKIADEIDGKYGEALDELVSTAISNDMHYNSPRSYEDFRNIATSLFANGISPGRIIALLLFGYRWIVRSISETSGSAFNSIFRMLVRFLQSDFISTYVASIGGWGALYHSLSTSSSVIFAVLAGLCVTLAIVFQQRR